MNLTLSPQDAWQPLPDAEWNADTARHLLRRTGWSAQPAEVTRALNDGLIPTLLRLYPEQPPVLAQPKSVADLEEGTPEFYRRIRQSTPEERRVLQREAREKSQSALFDLTIKWMQFSSHADTAAYEKWVSFLGNVYVVAAQGVNNTALLYQHQAVLRAGGMVPAPLLTKAVLRSPAMIMYLNLQQSRNGAPNENFARELMELFTLGVGNYTEDDVKAGARAFTGYRQRYGKFFFAPRLHDNGGKTFLGRTGNFDGDEIIDIIYQQKAAGTHLPARLTKYYLTDDPLPAAHLDALGAWWASTGYSLRGLAVRYFSSRLFFDPQFRGAYIKSPQHYYLGLMQDLSLSVAPLPRRLIPVMRLMGQPLYNPPNVRGWVGGREWINSATLDARRALVEALFSPLNEANLNADEQIALVAARADGIDNFTVTNDRLQPLAALSVAQITARFVDFFLPMKVDDAYRADVARFLTGDGLPAHKLARIRNAAITLLESPEYQLC